MSKCRECGHGAKHHTQFGCNGAFPNGTKGVEENAVFYGECLCREKPAPAKGEKP